MGKKQKKLEMALKKQGLFQQRCINIFVCKNSR
jgi:hypothetical protein